MMHGCALSTQEATLGPMQHRSVARSQTAAPHRSAPGSDSGSGSSCGGAEVRAEEASGTAEGPRGFAGATRASSSRGAPRSTWEVLLRGVSRAGRRTEKKSTPAANASTATPAATRRRFLPTVAAAAARCRIG